MSAAYVLARLTQLEESEARAASEIARLLSGNGAFYDLDPHNHKTGNRWLSSVSYTHLTLPTSDLV